MSCLKNSKNVMGTGVVYIPPSLRDRVSIERDTNWYVYCNKETHAKVNISQNPKNLAEFYHHITTKRSLESRPVAANEIVSYVLGELGINENNKQVRGKDKE